MDPQAEDVARLLAEAGLSSNFTMLKLPGGGNNRVYRVDCDGQSILLKAYFKDPNDLRDRLGAEFSFCRFAWDSGIRCVPRPFACNPQLGFALYEFIHGRTIAASEMSVEHIQQAVDFYRELNRHKYSPTASALANASEACFTLDEHLRCVQRRVDRLKAVDISTPNGRAASELIHRQLLPAWDRIHAAVLSGAAESGLAVLESICLRDRCLSPSDFGFHNALCSSDRLTFIDFEYAGWDDPAKTVCDFFCQPAVPAAEKYFHQFAEALAADLSDPQMHLRRMSLLLPVYRVKWCCILLNDFLPIGSRRRSFAHDAAAAEDRRDAQLRKARLAVERLFA